MRKVRATRHNGRKGKDGVFKAGQSYRYYAEDNVIKVRSETSFSKEVRQLASKLGIEYVKNVSVGGRSARGYKGLYVNRTMKDNPFFGR
ncbi:MAG: hypothetical protein K5894_01270 [Lachnospiraceae bacterium]|nr:hypothetical protein [Lachnospiraceae bacterium]